ncbi:MAG TPA: LacI family DNA-binding transcriptional regulator [bacterium]|nr:LacI family DNA-binding transcriptional regulator [bacterium]
MKKKDSYTLKQISAKSGFSETTVSRILSNQAAKYRISPETEKIVRALAEELHFVPNQLAQSLRLQKTNTIGLIIPDIANTFFSSIAQHVAIEARKIGYSVILVDTENSEVIEAESLLLLRSRKVDGLLITPIGLHSENLERLVANEMPLVLIDRYFPDSPIPYVGSDNFTGAYNALLHLIHNGHSRIACIQGLENAFPTMERLRGYHQAHRDQNLSVDPALITGNSFSFENGYMEMKLLLSYRPRPTALFAMSNTIALGALQALQEEGIKVPLDLSIVTFDDQPALGLLGTPLTTVAQQNEQLGSIAVKMLFHIISTKTNLSHKGILLPTQMIYRDSVRNLRGSALDVSATA